jgi:hypothetical protein
MLLNQLNLKIPGISERYKEVRRTSTFFVSVEIEF